MQVGGFVDISDKPFFFFYDPTILPPKHIITLGQGSGRIESAASFKSISLPFVTFQAFFNQKFSLCSRQAFQGFVQRWLIKKLRRITWLMQVCAHTLTFFCTFGLLVHHRSKIHELRATLKYHQSSFSIFYNSLLLFLKSS